MSFREKKISEKFRDMFSVIAQASCRITKPKESRASEGHLRIHLDMSKIPLINLENWKLD